MLAAGFALALNVQALTIAGIYAVLNTPVDAIPDLSETEAQSILSARPSLDSTEAPSDIFLTPAWLLTEAKVKASTLQKIEKSITTQTQVYRVHVIGVLNTQPQVTARVEAVIDTDHGRPRIIAWRDLSDWGTGVPNQLVP